MSAFISLAALKEALGMGGAANDTVDDGALQSTIYRASALVDNYLSQIRPGWVGISAGSNTRSSVGSNTRRYSGDNSDWLWIDDASSVASVTVDDTAITSTAYDLWPWNESPKRALVYVEPASSVRGLTTDHWARGTGNIDVVGFWGLNDVPDDIAQVTLQLAILLWRRYQSGDPAPGPAITTGGGQLAGTVNLDPEVLGILEQLYFRWGVPWVGGA